MCDWPALPATGLPSRQSAAYATFWMRGLRTVSK